MSRADTGELWRVEEKKKRLSLELDIFGAKLGKLPGFN